MPHTIVFHTRGLLRQVSLAPRDYNRAGTGGAKTTAYVTNVVARLEVSGCRPRAVYHRYTLLRPMTTEITKHTTYYSLYLWLKIPCAINKLLAY